MSRRVTSAFELEVFDQSASPARRLEEFLDVYAKHFSPKHRSPTNQLIHYQHQPLPGRRLIYFGLSFRSEACGFCVLMYYPAAGIGVFDFIVIAPLARGQGAYFVFADLIAEYLEQKRIIADYFVAEIMADDGLSDPRIGPQAIGRLVRMMGFRRAKILYHAPDPSIVSALYECRAALMIAANNERQSIPASELIRIFDLVYFNHYFLWYAPFLPPVERRRYEGVLKEERARFASRAKAHDPVILNGMRDHGIQLEPTSERHRVTLAVLVALSAATTIMLAVIPGVVTGWIVVGVACLLLGATVFSRRLRRFTLRLFGQQL